ncbi:hypothetical protein [Janibacter sp. DB-40]|uniref:hypothetical protein n=1 Tax=Janibacter sp. DB-40 TaxID=3028808 RepID=UPI002405A430|nr:hypothetical protein [Janibacter sp. DB-40]
MQATVFSQSPDTGAVVVTDAGLSHDVAPEVVAASGLRFLRPGQRVSITETDGVITRLWIVGIGDDEAIT